MVMQFKLFWAFTTECSTSSIPGEKGFSGSVWDCANPASQGICSNNSGIESQQWLGVSIGLPHVSPKLAGWSFSSVCRQEHKANMRLTGPHPQWTAAPQIIIYNFSL